MEVQRGCVLSPGSHSYEHQLCFHCMKFWRRELPIRVDVYTPELSVCLTPCHKLLFTCLLSVCLCGGNGTLPGCLLWGRGGFLPSKVRMGTGEVGLSPSLGGIEGIPLKALSPPTVICSRGCCATLSTPEASLYAVALALFTPTSHQAHCPVSPDILPCARLPPVLWSEQTLPLTVSEALAE